MNKKLITTNNEIERDVWEQLEGEPDLWFQRFTQFRLLGPRRTMRKAYVLSRQQEVGITVAEASTAGPSWREKAKMYCWKERAAAWDLHKLEEQEVAADKVFNEGLALVHNRVDHLKQLAEKMEKYLLDPRTTRLSPHLIEQLRGTYDDIAKELGQRVKETRLTGPGGGPVEITTSWGRGGSATDAWKVVEGTKVNEERIEGSD